MNLETKLIKSRVGLLNLAEQLNNVTRACKVMGTSRDSFYRIREPTAQAVKKGYGRSAVANPFPKTELNRKLK